jgi:molecular chaperone Hsp31 and glyoxalase 3
MLKKLLGIAPKLEMDGSYSPSKVALRLATADLTDFDNSTYQKYQGKKSKILVLFTEEKNMKMKNGKLFSTGNHPVEALLPMLHLNHAGFEFDIVTPTGKPVVFEMWAFPKRDENVKRIYQKHQHHFEKPKKLTDFIEHSFDDAASYAAIFIPGGHGAMIGIPQDKNVGKLLNWAHQNELFTISICHGPGSFLATTLNNKPFLYKGYKMCVFPDSVDQKTPMVGYLPGLMPFGLSEQLKSLGATIVNSKSDNTVCVDRKLITGASPVASNELGKIAAKTLLKEFHLIK